MFPFSISEIIGIVLENLRAALGWAIGGVAAAGALIWKEPLWGSMTVAAVGGFLWGLYSEANETLGSFSSLASTAVDQANDAANSVQDTLEGLPIVGGAAEAAYEAAAAARDFIGL